jgi:polyisoprenoid-binding protein YceI
MSAFEILYIYNMQKQIVIVSVTLLAVCSAFTVIIKQWKVDSENSKINFELPVHREKGTFRNLNAVINFDEKDLQASKITASIDVKTINTGNEKHDTHLKSPDFFDAEKYPTISFASTEIVKTESGYLAKGELTMKDSIKPIELPFTYTEQGQSKAVFNGTMTVNAEEFGVMKASSPGADKVIVYLVVPVTE